jgi:hypothetical protein
VEGIPALPEKDPAEVEDYVQDGVDYDPRGIRGSKIRTLRVHIGLPPVAD